MNPKQAQTDHDLLADRWSPYRFADRGVSADDLRALFEAARWAPSSYNEQPWSFLVATRDDTEAFGRLLSCLVDGNQAWARSAPVLALGAINRRFALNGKENRSAEHDLGLAAANLATEATARGLHVHQMIGIHQDKARGLYGIPGDCEAWTGFAIGHAADPDNLGSASKERDLAPRERKPLNEFIFTDAWGEASPILSKKG